MTKTINRNSAPGGYAATQDRIIRDGIEYVDAFAVQVEFGWTESYFNKMRKCGLPFIKSQTGRKTKYYYNLDKCRAWLAKGGGFCEKI